MKNKTNIQDLKKQAFLILLATVLLVQSVRANVVKTVQLEVVSCELYADFCLPISAKELTAFQLLNNGVEWTGDKAPCDLERVGDNLIAHKVALRLPVGKHHLVLEGAERMEFYVDVNCEETRPKQCKDIIDGGRAYDQTNKKLEIDVMPNQMLHYDIMVDGLPYTGAIAPSQIKVKSAFNFKDLFGKTFFVESFEINGQPFQGTFESPQAFLMQLKQWDQKGNWHLNAKGLLVGGHANQHYSDMVIAKKSSGERFLYEHFELNVANASSIQVAENALVEVKHIASGCSDNINLETIAQRPTTRTASK